MEGIDCGDTGNGVRNGGKQWIGERIGVERCIVDHSCVGCNRHQAPGTVVHRQFSR